MYNTGQNDKSVRMNFEKPRFCKERTNEMAEYTLVTDSTCDLDSGLYEKMGVRVIAMHYTVNDREYVDDGTNDSHEFYEMLHNGASASTMQINAQTYLDVFEEEFARGNDVLYFCFASVLSGSYNNALYAVQECAEKWPDRRVIVIDSKSECGGEGLLVYHAAELKKSGMEIDALARWAEDAIQRHCHYFTVNDLNHLYRGGRVSRGAAVMGTLVGIKPVMYTNSKGELCVGAKVRGRMQAVRMLADKVAAKIMEPEKQIIFINHADCMEDAERLAEDIRSRVKPAEVRILNLGPVIGAHVGPGCLAVFFVGNNRDW